MVNMFMWFSDIKYIQDSDGQIFLDEKPELSWNYNIIRYYNAEKIWEDDSGIHDLSEQQCLELDNFIKQKRNEVGILKLCVDKDGNYLGIVSVNDERVFKIVDQSPPNADPHIYDFENNNWKKIYYYSKSGFLTSKDAPDVDSFTTKPIPQHFVFQYEFDKQIEDWKIIETPQFIETYKNYYMRMYLTMFLEALSIQNLEVTTLSNALKNLNINNTSTDSIINSLNQLDNLSTANDIRQMFDTTRENILSSVSRKEIPTANTA